MASHVDGDEPLAADHDAPTRRQDPLALVDVGSGTYTVALTSSNEARTSHAVPGGRSRLVSMERPAPFRR
jgi:cell division ATPase FtsA